MPCPRTTATGPLRALLTTHRSCFFRGHLRIARSPGVTRKHARDTGVSRRSQHRPRLPISSFFLTTTSTNSVMLFLLFVYFLTQSNPGSDASPIPLLDPRADISCNDANNCRTIWSIIWSCLSTVFLCTWVTLHPNIAVAPDTPGMGGFEAKLRGFLKDKLLLFIWALLVPEYILAWAIRQYLAAGEIQQKCNTHQKNTNRNPSSAREWTRAHGFFIIMGGFHLYSLPDGAPCLAYPSELSIPSKFVLPPGHSRDIGTPEHPLGFKDLAADYNALEYLAPTETGIKDRGKADIIAKTLVILQTSWFVAQCIARGVKSLPLTELEVVTLAYATMNAFIYYFWWDKPKDVGCSVRIYTASKADGLESEELKEWAGGAWGKFVQIVIYVVGGQDNYFRLSEESRVPMFWSGNSGDAIEQRSMFGASILGMIFRAIHFIAWNSKFPSAIELLLWRISCVAMTAVPLIVTFICGVLQMKGRGTWSIIILMIPFFTLPLTGLLYCFARISTLGMAFTTLRALPPDAFKTIDWATFIPHL